MICMIIYNDTPTCRA